MIRSFSDDKISGFHNLMNSDVIIHLAYSATTMSSVDSAVLAQIRVQLESLQLSQQVLQAKVSPSICSPFVADIIAAD